MRNNLAIFCLLCIVLTMIGCEGSVIVNNKININLSEELSRENIEKLRLYRDKKEKYFIEENRNSMKTFLDNDNYLLLNSGAFLTINDNGEIVRVMVIITQTKRGISYGDSKSDVIKAYGQTYIERNEYELDVVEYQDKDSNVRLDFWLDDNGDVEYIFVGNIEVQ
ncbi:hypothetical protein [Alkalihalobacterium elongatum]|uniref:hypothetical protein n=1 Tax=Alkalihalobacterium elongatum TaxID=2675466 RepID=UPI001C1F22EC|nr:hypothetical protein [Alkalihalobacterium elongatum]